MCLLHTLGRSKDRALVNRSPWSRRHDPAPDGDIERKDHDHDAKNAQDDIANLLVPCLCNLVMEHGGEDEAQRHARHRAHERHELVQVGASDSKGNQGTGTDQHGPQRVLEHLDPEVERSRLFTKDAMLQNLAGGRKLQGYREDDGERIQQLDRDGHTAADGQVQQHDGLDLVTKT